MHPNPVFHDASVAANLAYARARGFGMLAIGAPDGPLLAHVPFLLEPATMLADLHLVRSNPIARALRGGPLAARIAVTGPDAYVSPDWYGVADQVPTWNYVAVHLTGSLELLPEEALRDLLDRESAHFENGLLPKTPWTADKMTPEVMDRMMRAILPCRMRVSAVDGTWKLGQNKPEAVRHAAADHLANGGATELAALMRGVDGQS